MLHRHDLNRRMRQDAANVLRRGRIVVTHSAA